jgi:hypothetical protein
MSGRRERIPLVPAWVWLLALACAPLLLINCSVAFFGSTLVFPLSPFALKEKSHALGQYFQHRAFCVFTGHDDMRMVVDAAARRRHVEPALLHAVIGVESGYRPHRISPAGAMGPAQLIAGTAEMLGVDDPYDPQAGVDGGARYLREMLDRFKGDRRLAVAAYNAGPGAVVGGRVPQNGETEDYVEKVMRAYRENKAKEPAPPPAQPPAMIAKQAPPHSPTVKPAPTRKKPVLVAKPGPAPRTPEREPATKPKLKRQVLRDAAAGSAGD